MSDTQEKQIINAPCGCCQKPSGKTAKYSPYMSGDQIVDGYEEVLCDACIKEMEAHAVDAKDIAQIEREWRAYRNQGLGNAG